MIALLPAIHRFIEAHDRYLALNEARTDFASPHERELFHIEIMKAYLEVQYRAQVIADCNTPTVWTSLTCNKPPVARDVACDW